PFHGAGPCAWSGTGWTVPARAATLVRMPQAVWTGTLSFGLVSIPVKLYGATSPRDVRFHQFEGRSGRRVRYRRVTNEADVPLWEIPLLRDAPAPRAEPETAPQEERAAV